MSEEPINYKVVCDKCNSEIERYLKDNEGCIVYYCPCCKYNHSLSSWSEKTFFMKWKAFYDKIFTQ